MSTFDQFPTWASDLQRTGQPKKAEAVRPMPSISFADPEPVQAERKKPGRPKGSKNIRMQPKGK